MRPDAPLDAVASSQKAAPAPRDVEPEGVIVDKWSVSLVKEWRAKRGEKYDSSNPESEWRAFAADLDKQLERLAAHTANKVRDLERGNQAMSRMKLWCKSAWFTADVDEVTSQHPNWSGSDAVREVFDHYYRQFYDGVVVPQRYRQPDAARDPNYRPQEFEAIPD